MSDEAAPQGTGPWGEAIAYWLKKKIRQAALVRGTKITANTISTIVRGFPTQTSKLEQIAIWLKVPFTAVLVSPLQLADPKTQHRRAKVEMQQALVSMTTGQRLDEATIDAAKRLQALKGAWREEALVAIKNLEQAQRLALRKRRSPPRK